MSELSIQEIEIVAGGYDLWLELFLNVEIAGWMYENGECLPT